MKKFYADLIEAVLKQGAVKATKYVSEEYILRATRRRFKGRIFKEHTEIVFTTGAPNYAEQRFIRLALKTGEVFPVKKIQLKWAKPD